MLAFIFLFHRKSVTKKYVLNISTRIFMLAKIFIIHHLSFLVFSQSTDYNWAVWIVVACFVFLKDSLSFDREIWIYEYEYKYKYIYIVLVSRQPP